MSTPFIGHAVAAAAVAILSLSPVPPSAQQKQAGPAQAGTAKSAPGGPATKTSIAELWVQPKNIAERDLLLGPGGPKDAPLKDGVYSVVGQDSTGNSFGYDVTDEQGRTWDLKVGNPGSSPRWWRAACSGRSAITSPSCTFFRRGRRRVTKPCRNRPRVFACNPITRARPIGPGKQTRSAAPGR